MDSAGHIILIFASFGGFLLAFYIRHKKQTGEKMVCPLNSNCDVVIHSKYSKFLGAPVEILGLFYYGFIAITHGLFLVFPHLASLFAVFSVLVLTIVAFLFSLYLTFIQAFTLKQWCAWCLMSAGICSIIFAVSASFSEFGLVFILEHYHQLIRIGHILGFALGLGAATITDIFFFKFLKDFRISEWESETLHTLSQIIWFALALLLLTGVGLYLPEMERLNQSPKFLVKMIVLVVITINGAFLNLLVAPKLTQISFGGQHKHEVGELRHFRKIAFVLGAISITSWYSAFILGMLRESPFEFWPMLSIYLLLILSGVIGSQFAERLLRKRASAATANE